MIFRRLEDSIEVVHPPRNSGATLMCFVRLWIEAQVISDFAWVRGHEL